METSSTLSLSSQTTALPTRFLQSKRIYLDRDPNTTLKFYPPQDFWTRFGSTEVGPPKIYTIEGNDIVVGPVPDLTYSAPMLYYQRPTAMATTVPTLFDENPDLYLYAALLATAPYQTDDSRVMTWGAMFEQIVKDIERQDKWDRYPNAPIAQRTDVWTAPSRRSRSA